MEDLIANRSPRALLASSQRSATSGEGHHLWGPRASAVVEDGGTLHFSIIRGTHLGWCVHWLGEIFQFGGQRCDQDHGLSSPWGRASDACSDVSKTAQERSSLTSMVMLTSPSAFGRETRWACDQVRRRVTAEGGALSSGPSAMDWGMSTFR